MIMERKPSKKTSFYIFYGDILLHMIDIWWWGSGMSLTYVKGSFPLKV